MKKRWSARKVVLGSVIICLAVLVIGFVAGCNFGFISDNGYQLGHSEGYIAGYEDGYDNGIDVGRTHGYSVMDPTYSEMMDFIARDKTNENEYVEGAYTCYNFTADVCKNADDENIRCAYVGVWFPVEAHACVAFNTIDRGLVFIEPITDEERTIEIGKPYWSREEYSPPDYDDTVKYLVIIW